MQRQECASIASPFFSRRLLEPALLALLLCVAPAAGTFGLPEATSPGRLGADALPLHIYAWERGEAGNPWDDCLLLDMHQPPGAAPQADDLRLTQCGLRQAGSALAIGDPEVGAATSSAAGPQVVFADSNGSPGYDAGDCLYVRPRPGAGLLESAGDAWTLRLTDCMGHPAGTLVRGGSKHPLNSTAGAFVFTDLDANGRYDAGEPVALNLTRASPLYLDLATGALETATGGRVATPARLRDVRFLDLDGSGGYGPGDALALHPGEPGSARLAVGDLRLTAFDGRPAGSQIAVGEPGVTYPPPAPAHYGAFCFVDPNQTGKLDLNEQIYLQPACGPVGPQSLRLRSGVSAYPGGTLVGAGDADLGDLSTPLDAHIGFVDTDGDGAPNGSAAGPESLVLAINGDAARVLQLEGKEAFQFLAQSSVTGAVDLGGVALSAALNQTLSPSGTGDQAGAFVVVQTSGRSAASPGDAVYYRPLPKDAANAPPSRVQAGDLRLTRFATLASLGPGLRVASGDADLSPGAYSLSPALGSAPQLCYVDGNTDAAFQPTEPLYLEPSCARAEVGALRLLPRFGTLVLGPDADADADRDYLAYRATAEPLEASAGWLQLGQGAQFTASDAAFVLPLPAGTRTAAIPPGSVHVDGTPTLRLMPPDLGQLKRGAHPTFQLRVDNPHREAVQFTVEWPKLEGVTFTPAGPQPYEVAAGGSLNVSFEVGVGREAGATGTGEVQLVDAGLGHGKLAGWEATVRVAPGCGLLCGTLQLTLDPPALVELRRGVRSAHHLAVTNPNQEDVTFQVRWPTPDGFTLTPKEGPSYMVRGNDTLNVPFDIEVGPDAQANGNWTFLLDATSGNGEAVSVQPATWDVRVLGSSFPWLLLAVGIAAAAAIAYGVKAARGLRKPVQASQPPHSTKAQPPSRPPQPTKANPAKAAAAAVAGRTRAKPAREPRYVNLLLHGEAGACDPATPLTPRANLMLTVDIGSLLEASLVDPESNVPFPEEALPPSQDGHLLEVVVASRDFEVEPVGHRYFLPRHGRGWACACPPDAATCLGHPDAGPLAIPVKAPAAGLARLRVAIYHRGNVLQSLHLDAHVGAAPPAGPAVQARLDYSLAPSLAGLDAFPPVTATLLHNDNNGTHTVVMHGQGPRSCVFAWNEAQVASAIRSARLRLFAVHAAGDPVQPQSTWRNLLGDGGTKTAAAFKADLRDLAMLGSDLYNLMYLQDPDGMKALRRALAAGGDTVLQCARTKGSTLYFPWSLVYDVRNDGGELESCPMLEEWDAVWRGRQLPADCPYGCTKPGARNRLCPYGFWGIRHLLEEPPTLPPGREPRLVVTATNRPPRMVAALSQDLDGGLTKTHLERVGRSLAPFVVDGRPDPESILAALDAPALELAYFYCHGGAQTQGGRRKAFLEIGKGFRCTPDVLLLREDSWGDDHWAQTAPLVFLNGCHTAAMEPGDLTTLVDTFIVLKAAGVVGTEVPLLQSLASNAAEEFLAALPGATVAQAMRQMRLRLLAKGNLMGLAYTPYCQGALRLEVTP
ncbi:MAG: elongation factor Tu [Thermoplasmata archaeon]|nr:elongation factor Tu [Thermoplasmata archaeon]